MGFGADWFRFQVCTTHVLYGEADPENLERVEEIKALSGFLAERAKEKHAWAKNMILLGDFNVFDTTDATMRAITDAGFVVLERLQELPSNAPKTKHYDQIAFVASQLENHLELSEAGVFDLYAYVYREEDEEDLAARLKKMTDQVTAPPEKTIYNFHCPPYGSGLDDAPELTEDLRPKHGGRSIVPVGSKAVREAIEEGQPALALHGHIHEAKGNTRIGNTLCINPGSSYEQGQLLGAVVNLDGGKKVKRFVLTTG